MTDAAICIKPVISSLSCLHFFLIDSDMPKRYLEYLEQRTELESESGTSMDHSNMTAESHLLIDRLLQTFCMRARERERGKGRTRFKLTTIIYMDISLN